MGSLRRVDAGGTVCHALAPEKVPDTVSSERRRNYV